MAIIPMIRKQSRKNIKLEKLIDQALRTLKHCVENPCDDVQIPASPIGRQRASSSSRELQRPPVEVISKLRVVVETHYTVENGETSATAKHMVAFLLAHDVPLQLLQSMASVDSGTARQVSSIVCTLFQGGYSDLSKAVTEYMKLRAKELFGLLKRLYEKEEFVAVVGPVLRVCLRRKERFFVRKSLRRETGLIESVIKRLIASKSGEVAEDGYRTLLALLLPASSDERIPAFLVEDYARLRDLWNSVLANGSRQSKKFVLYLIGKLLFERDNYEFRCKYVSDESNFEAFWSLFASGCPCFEINARATLKLFVANPQKSPEMEKLLAERKGHLIQVVAQTCDRQSIASLNESNELISSLHQLDCAARSQSEVVPLDS